MAVKFIKRAEVERAEIENLQKSAGVCSEIAELLCERGVNTPEKVQKFFYPKLHDMQSPFEINGVREAVERINRARENNDRILIYGLRRHLLGCNVFEVFCRNQRFRQLLYP